MKVVVIGTGYVGLTTGLCLAWIGHDVTCLDIDARKIESLRRGVPPVHEPGLDQLMDAVESRIRYETDPRGCLPGADVVFIAVGTPPLPDGNPDLQYLRAAAEEVGRCLNGDFAVIVNKSTVPVGAGHWIDSIIRDAGDPAGGFPEGRPPDISHAVASNPEFLREGSAIHDSLYPDRIVIGFDDPRVLPVLSELYRPVLEQSFPAPHFAPRPENFSAAPLVTANLASAELIKYAANAFLATKISFANEIGALAEKVGANITQVVRGMGLDSRIGARFLQAGVGWGGSCFGKDTAALVAIGREYSLPMRIVQATRDVNYSQRDRIIEKLLAELKIMKGKTIGILGISFKPNTDDIRDSPALDIARRLIDRGAKVRAHDPIALDAARAHPAGCGVDFCDSVTAMAHNLDAFVLVTEWPDYQALPWDALAVKMRCRLVVDGRNFLSQKELEASGYRYVGMGV